MPDVLVVVVLTSIETVLLLTVRIDYWWCYFTTFSISKKGCIAETSSILIQKDSAHFLVYPVQYCDKKVSKLSNIENFANLNLLAFGTF